MDTAALLGLSPTSIFGMMVVAILALGGVIGVLYKRNVALSDGRVELTTQVTAALAAAGERERAMGQAAAAIAQATREAGAVVDKLERQVDRLDDLTRRRP